MPTKGKSKKKQFKKKQFDIILNTPLRCVVFAFLLIGAVVSLINPPLKMVADTTSGLPGKTPELTDGVKIKQKFTVDRDYDFFGLHFPNYLNFFKDGTLHVTLTDSEQHVDKFEYSVNQMLNESYFYIDSELHAGEDYSLEVWVDDIPKEKAFTFSTIKLDEDVDGEPMTVNGKAYDESLLMTFVYEKKDYFVVWYFAFGIVLTLIYMVLFPKKEGHAKSK